MLSKITTLAAGLALAAAVSVSATAGQTPGAGGFRDPQVAQASGNATSQQPVAPGSSTGLRTVTGVARKVTRQAGSLAAQQSRNLPRAAFTGKP